MAVVTIIAIMLAIIPLATQPPLQYIAALILMIVGIFVYYPVVYKKKRLPGMDSFRYFMQVLFEAVPTSNPEEYN